MTTETRTVQDELRTIAKYSLGEDKPRSAYIVGQAADRIDALESPFASADNGDWRALDLLLGHTAHGQYWRGVFVQLRAALSPPSDNSDAQAGSIK